MRVPSATGLVFASLAISSGSTLAAPAVLPPPSPNPGAGSPNPGLNSVKSPRPNGLESPHMGSPRMLHQSFFNSRSKLGPPAIRTGSGSRRSLPRKKRDITPPNSPSFVTEGAGSVSAQGLGLLKPDGAAAVGNLIKTVAESLPAGGPLLNKVGDGAVELLSRDEAISSRTPEPLPEEVIATPMVRSLAHMSLRDERELLGALSSDTPEASVGEPALVGPLIGKNGQVLMEASRGLNDATTPTANTRRQVTPPDAQTVTVEGLGLLPPDLAATVGGLLKTVGGVVGGLPAPLGPTLGGVVNGVGDVATGLLGRDVDHQLEARSTEGNEDEDSCEEDPDCDDAGDGDTGAPQQGHTRRSYIPFPRLPGEAIPGFASAWSSGAAQAYDDASSTLTASAMGVPVVDSLSMPISPDVAANLVQAMAPNQLHGFPSSFIPRPDPSSIMNTAPSLPVTPGGNTHQSPQDANPQQAPTQGEMPATPLPDVRGFAGQTLGSVPVAGSLVKGLYGQVGQPPTSVASMIGQVSPHQNAIVGFLPNGMPVFGQLPQPVQAMTQNLPLPQNSRQGQREQYSEGESAVPNPMGQAIQTIKQTPALNQVIQTVQGTPAGNAIGMVQNALNTGVNTLTGVTNTAGGVLPIQQLGGILQGLNLPIGASNPASSAGGLFGLLNAEVEGDKLAALDSSSPPAIPNTPSGAPAAPVSLPSQSQSSGNPSGTATWSSTPSSTSTTQAGAAATPPTNDETSAFSEVGNDDWAGAASGYSEEGSETPAGVASVSVPPTMNGSDQPATTWASSSAASSYAATETGSQTAGLAKQSASALEGASTTATPSAASQ